MAAGRGLLRSLQISLRYGAVGVGTPSQFVRNVNSSLKNSQESKNRRLLWCLAGSFVVGTALGAQVHKHYYSKETRTLLKEPFKIVHARPVRVDDARRSGSPPHSKTFNFIADAVEAVAPAVVYIEVTSRQSGFFGPVGATSSGSGFIVTEEGVVLTNAHVVQNAVEVSVRLPDGREFSGVVVDIDPVKDLAAIKLKTKLVSIQQIP